MLKESYSSGSERKEKIVTPQKVVIKKLPKLTSYFAVIKTSESSNK